MTTSSNTHLVLIPSFNSGPLLLTTVKTAIAEWKHVWVIVDGSTDGSEMPVKELAEKEPWLRVILRSVNGGKGAAIVTGCKAALASGYTHLLTMDADGQHSPGHVRSFMDASLAHPNAVILGRPVFGSDVPPERLYGRKLSVGLAFLEILGPGIDDPLFGFRVYPASPLEKALNSTRWGRGFDFDPEMAVRMFWAGAPTVNLPAPCNYLSESAGGITHFHYLRDNLKLLWLHIRLITQLLWRWPAIRTLRHRRQGDTRSAK